VRVNYDWRVETYAKLRGGVRVYVEKFWCAEGDGDVAGWRWGGSEPGVSVNTLPLISVAMSRDEATSKAEAWMKDRLRAKACEAWKKHGRAKSNEVDLSHTYGEAEHEVLVRVGLGSPEDPAEVVAVGPDGDEAAEAGLDFAAIKTAIENDEALMDDLRLQDAAERDADAARDR
jgi:hypothetical protein